MIDGVTARLIALERDVSKLEDGTAGPFPVVQVQMAQLSSDVQTLSTRVDRLARSVWGLLIVLLVVAVGLIANLLVVIVGAP